MKVIFGFATHPLTLGSITPACAFFRFKLDFLLKHSYNVSHFEEFKSTCTFTRAATETMMAIVDTAMSKEPMMRVPDLRLVQPQHFLLPSGSVIPSIIFCSTNSQNCRMWCLKCLRTITAAAEKKRDCLSLGLCDADATKLFWGKVKQRA